MAELSFSFFLSQTFDEAGLCESLSKNVTKSGYVKPTPVQKYGIPIISAGRDLMACAQTGSGKTARTTLLHPVYLMINFTVSVFSRLLVHVSFLVMSGFLCSFEDVI